MKKVSVVIPSLNDAKLLSKCLISLREQDYDQSKIEILVIDGGSKDNTKKVCQKYKARFILERNGSPEMAKGVGVRKAKGEIILMLDCDNQLPTNNWLKEMMEVFSLEKEIVGVYTLRYLYRKKDKILNRYFSLFGVNDPVAWFLDKADRQSYLCENYNLLGKVTDKKKYFSVEFEKDKIPTLGANGFLIRKEMLNKAKIKEDKFFHIDINVDLIEKGFNKYGVVKNSIVHASGDNVWRFFGKRKRYMDELYLRDFEKRRYFLYDPEKDLVKIIFYCAYSLSVILPLLTSIYGYLKKKDLAWFLHPLMCLGMMWVYGSVVIKNVLSKSFG